MTFVFVIGLLIPNPFIALIAGAACICVEILLLNVIAKGLDKFPGIKRCGDNIRTAMSYVIDIALLIGGILAAQAIMPTTGLFIIVAFWCINKCSKKPLVSMAVGPLGAIYAVAGGITIGQLSIFLNYANQYTKPFNEISGVVTELQNALACAARVFELLDAEDQTPEAENAAKLVPDGHVQIEDVSFRYLPDRPLIEGLSLDVKPGQRIAIVGPTGCGKTTLINLLMRFYDVNGGSIKVSGTDIRDVTRASLRGSYGMVLQDTWLRAGTVRENIAYGKPDATLDEVVAAAKAAHADSFIRRLPEGYDTVIAEDGGNISQGQKQLLCIARVMLCLPPMLILDEATSSIDTRTEVRIQAAFARMMQGRTSFIVAHRLSTIREADVILVMKDGHIVEQGDHDTLLAQGGFYAKLYNSQFEGVET